ncbi:MAG: YkvA family protein [Lentisphaeria bacterium]|nr:YkvA family protein [Lentisphaeria bacterium]
MNSSRQKEVSERFSDGIEKVTEKDISSVLNRKEKAFRLSRHLEKAADDFKLLWNLLCDYQSGSYKEVPWKMIAATVFSIGYLLMPLDVIPDVIPIIGFTDDITVFGFVLAGFSAELDSYKIWKQCHPSSPDTVSGEEEK